uniref:AAA family ATPase n=1 Tax=Fulvivirga sp. TaxID=1931237 RepID=UPI00404BA349
MIKKIAIIGPESTGKSTLASQLADALQTVWVSEYARTYIDQLDRPYEESDLLTIAKNQIALEDELLPQANHYLVVDTTLTIIRVWSEHKYGRCDPWILSEEAARQYDCYLLCDIDLPWQDDPQREHPHLRNHFFEVYKRYLESKSASYCIVSGDGRERLQAALGFLSGNGEVV